MPMELSYFGTIIDQLIDLVGRVFAYGPGDLGSIPGHVIPKTQKWYLNPPCLTLSTIRYVSRVKWSNSGKGVAPSPTPRCSSYWKRRLLVALDYDRQLYFLLYLLREKAKRRAGIERRNSTFEAGGRSHHDLVLFTNEAFFNKLSS